MIYGIKDNKSFENVIFTYVVDSDQALKDWADNIAGNDYSCVLIKKGSWSCEQGINLTTTNTKVVIGEVDSKLIFNSEFGLFYAELPDELNYFMQNVFVEINVATSYENIPFYKCINLTNCKGIVNNTTGQGRCFADCENLINCYANGYGALGGTGFYNCRNLLNCHGVAITQSENNQCGFMGCYNLESCKGEGYQRGFSGCSYVVGCRATGIGGYGFYSCNGMARCRKLGDSLTATFDTSNCNASLEPFNSNYVVANTPEGGFNNLL